MKETNIIESCRFFISFVPHIFLFLFFFNLTTCDSINVPSDKILLNCGSSGASQFNGVNWIGDIGSSFLPPAYDKSSTSFLVSNTHPLAPKVPYSTARTIHSPLTYSFPFSPGLKFIRFYFLSTSYLMMNPSNAYFSVKAGPYTLVSNFSPSVAAEELNLVYITKHFLVNVNEKKLNITFSPSPLISNAFAFVNGIEIFSVPPSTYFQGSKVRVPYLGHQETLFINDEYALEMLYLVQVGGDDHTVDVGNSFGTWSEDKSSIFGLQYGSVLNIKSRPVNLNYTTMSSNDYNFSAPEELYWTARTMGSNGDNNMRYNLTWSFPVDSGFNYLVRLHFCEISLEVTRFNQRVFKVFINNQTAEERMDLVALAGAPFTPLYRDYVVMVPMKSETRQDMWIALHPNLESNPKYADAILNGIEIIKLSDSNYNLASSFQLKKEQKEKKKKKLPHVIVVAAISGIILVLFITCLILIRRAWKKLKRGNFWVLPLNHTGRSQENIQVTVTSGHGYHQFTLAEISIATNKFSEALVIGEGGFGKVYKGIMHGGVTPVAIKRSKPSSGQGFKEFQNEINFFSFCHMNLVSLLGYCQEGNELILVYEYMAQGSLCDHLYKKQKQPLPWNQRLKICVGAARGLHYLHTGTRHPVIHRDIKSSNILLDHNFVPKIADFGLSRIVPSIYHSHVSTEVKGTFGYLDPEYYKRRKLTEKSDVFSFGVVLFEVLCGRPAVNPIAVEEESEKVGLAQWALHCYQSGTIDQLVDQHLDGKIKPEYLMAFVDIGIQCLANKSAERPTMGEVLSNLEKIFSLHESLEEREITTGQFIHETGLEYMT
ncbi:receptor-like protein kinase FERONIA [Gastrolobium bilobum]|uniref:receptor-like protein kinase FERONIA n=1 Tax=Gastrolobium bilobum TaxID=150636 RepID=UPI002AB0C168|nr:receptor-like protein kinase FERONIA [Gastrolobium bilobum]